MNNETILPEETKHSRDGGSVQRLVRRFYEASAVTFWKIEAREWRKLYEEQRGGEAFNSIQKQLAEARAEISRLKSSSPNGD